jgi:hypothetical protein
MKNVAILVLLCIPLIGLSQNAKQPKYYLNSEEYNMDSVFLNLNKIDSIWVKKDIPEGEIFIRTKSQPWEYYSIDDFLKRTPQYSQIIDKSIMPVFIINGKVINKKSDAKIDRSYYAKVRIGRLSNVYGLPAKSKKIVIVNIELTDKDPSKDIRIRGDSLIDTGT